MMKQNIPLFILTEAINEKDYIFESLYSTNISSMHHYLGKASGRIIDSVVDHIISI